MSAELPGPQDQHVAGVRVGVEGALEEDLPEQVAQQPAGQRRPVGPELVQLGAGVADGDAVEPLQDQEPAAGDVGVHGRDEHGGVGWGGGGDHGDVTGLDAEVEFLGEGVGEAAAQLADVPGAGQLGLRFGAAGQPADHLQVPADLLVDPGPLDLEDDRGAVAAPGRVRLRQRRAGQRLGVNALEHLAGVAAEFFAQQGLDLRPRRGGHLVLQFGQLGGHRQG